MKHCAVVATIVLISLGAALSAVEPQSTEETNWRSAPWWRALRAESYYKQCHSSCTELSQGTKTTVELCDDSEVCRGRKQTLDEYATKQCSQWSHSLATVTLTGEGRRFKQEPSIGSWISCAIFCRTDKDQWYSPRRELGSQSYYPDGIWCHRDSSGNDYFCQKNLCLPPKYEVTEALRLAREAEEKFVRDAAAADSSYVVVDEDKGIVTAVDAATLYGNFDAASP